ncbi:MAG: 50S ribosomal protein L17 [Tissierellia bacterium]|nr:50S ribosomal protein L17 [Tissierellia bacterium]
MSYRKLGRETSHRLSMLKGMSTALLRHGSIITTQAKAKEVQRSVEKMITLGKRGDLHARRQAVSYLQDKEVVSKLFDEIAPGYEERSGGYTRIYKLGHRRGDAAPMAKIELV